MKTPIKMCITLLCISTVACGASDKELVFRMQDGLTAADVKLAEQGVKTLIEACPGIATYWSDLSQQSPVSLKNASLTDERERGWKRAVEIVLKASTSPKTIPSSFRANGHVCYFDVGVSAPYGVSIAKSACAAICKSSAENPSLLFVLAK